MAGAGCVEQTGARFWYRTARPGRLELTLRQGSRTVHAVSFDVSRESDTDGTGSVALGLSGPPALEPGSRYSWSLHRTGDGTELGSGELVTSPASVRLTPPRFSVAVGSCHQPFDDEGATKPTSMAMLTALHRTFEEGMVARTLLLGDQMYADLPAGCSLFDPSYFTRIAPPGREHILDCSRQEVRRIYHARYRAFLGVEPFRRLQQCTPTLMVPDDHELVDNFGSAVEHASERWRALREGALDACYDYEGLRTHPRFPTRPESMHTTMVYGPLACFIMDLRSQKRADEQRIQVYGATQHRALRDFLAAHAHRPIFMLGLSVPLAYVPDWLATLGARAGGETRDAADRWGFAKAEESRDRLVALLSDHRRRHPHQQLLIVAGDVHAGMASRITWLPSEVEAVQFVSSGLSHTEGSLHARAAELLPRLSLAGEVGKGAARCRVDLLDGVGTRAHNPYGEVNCGLVEVRRDRRGWNVRLLLLGLESVESARTKVVFESEPLRVPQRQAARSASPPGP